MGVKIWHTVRRPTPKRKTVNLRPLHTSSLAFAGLLSVSFRSETDKGAFLFSNVNNPNGFTKFPNQASGKLVFLPFHSG